jgi:hypothetical protein
MACYAAGRRDFNMSSCFTEFALLTTGGSMTIHAHLETLKKKHHDMSEAIEAAQRAPGIDGLKVADMKKKKMRLKEEISRLSN